MNQRQMFLHSCIVCFCLILCGCHKQETTETLSSPPPDRKVSALGRIQPETEIRKVAVPGAVAGDRIEEILVTENQIVKKGQPLATLNSYESLNASLDEAVQQVAVAQSKLNQVKAGAKTSEIKAQEYKVESLRRQLNAEHKAQDEKVARCRYQMEESKRQYDRYQHLLKDGAVSASEVDRYLVASQSAEKSLAEAIETRAGKLRTLEAQIDSELQTREKIAEVRPVDVNVAESELKKAIAVRNKAEKELSFATVRSPQNGQILKITARPGDKVGEAGILEMADTSKMIVVAEVYQTDIPKIHIGQTAKITSDGFPNSITGTVFELGSQVTKQKIFGGQAGENLDLRVFEVKLRLDPKDIERGVKRASNLQVNVVFEPSTGSAG